MFRALGKNEPPKSIQIGERHFLLQRVFKHDSWAATALYRCANEQIVCKLNRTQSVLGFPMRWMGVWLAKREANFFRLLAGVPGIPVGFDRVLIDGRIAPNAFAHAFVPGRPLSLVHDADQSYFDQLHALVAAIHQRQMAYVDLNKPENVLVGDDGRPYLFDFQISVRLPNWPGARWLLKLLQQSDQYHLVKHETWRLHRESFEQRMQQNRPWWIRWHRTVGVPLRAARRRLLVALGIRRGRGWATSERAPEHGLCTPENVASENEAYKNRAA